MRKKRSLRQQWRSFLRKCKWIERLELDRASQIRLVAANVKANLAKRNNPRNANKLAFLLDTDGCDFKTNAVKTSRGTSFQGLRQKTAVRTERINDAGEYAYKRTRRTKKRLNRDEDVTFAPEGLPPLNLNQISALCLSGHENALEYWSCAMQDRSHSPDYRATGTVPSYSDLG